MKLSVLALDYDGTIAVDGRLESGARQAIAAARSNGVLVLLVTGRILAELTKVAGDLHFVDAVVAENGAVLHFPESDHTRVLAPEVSPLFIEELRRRGVAATAGVCLVDAAADRAPAILGAIHDLELPLVLAFNRGRVMTTPQGISKATGLQAVLATLRRSPRNMLAIGDAENDHEMLRLAEVGGAVEWGSPVLRRAADLVVPGSSPAATASFIRSAIERAWLPRTTHPRRRLHLGYLSDGTPLSLASQGRNVLIAGDARSGKSWIGGLLTEQLILHGYSVCVIDPEGDYRSLEALPGVAVLGGNDPPPTPRQLLESLRYPDRSVIIDLSHLPQDAKIAQIRAILPALKVMRRKTGLPHRVLLDEAHYYLQEPAAAQLLDLELNAYTIVTFSPSRLPEEILRSAEVVIATCGSNAVELECLGQLAGPDIAQEGWTSTLCHLRGGHAAVLPPTEEAGGVLRQFSLVQRLTPHVRHRQKYVDVPVTDAHAFRFSPYGHLRERRIRTLREFVAEIESAPPASLTDYLLRRDFSRWIGEVFGDRRLAGDVARLEARDRSGARLETAALIADAVRGRYDLTDTEWERGAGETVTSTAS
jgi:hydroxymethylpyrimidine pyrophosphatase-like HAD family hydrolase